MNASLAGVAGCCRSHLAFLVSVPSPFKGTISDGFYRVPGQQVPESLLSFPFFLQEGK